MTKLQEWLTVFSILFAVWFYALTNKSQLKFVQEHYNFVFYSPVLLALMFGVYATMTVLYRVYTFNDCKEAAVELQNEIQEAKESLSKLGFKFKQQSNIT